MAQESLRVLIIDDENEHRQAIGTQLKVLGHSPDYVNSWENAYLRLNEAFEENMPFHIVTIDVKFILAGTEISQGKEILNLHSSGQRSEK